MGCVENYGTMDKLDLGMTHRLFKLEQENKMMRELILDWMDFEHKSIEKHGKYSGENINRLIARGEQVLNKLTKDKECLD
jgi:hypothetical protein